MKDGCPRAVKDSGGNCLQFRWQALCFVPYNCLFSSLSLIGNLWWGNVCPVGWGPWSSYEWSKLLGIISLRDSFSWLTYSRAWTLYYVAESKDNIRQNKNCMPHMIGTHIPCFHSSTMRLKLHINYKKWQIKKTSFNENLKIIHITLLL